MEIKNSGNRIVAAEGKVLRRISDGFVAGPELWIGYTYYLHGEKLDKPLLELPEHYEEIYAPDEFDNNLNVD